MTNDPTAAGCTDPCIACMTDESHDPAPQPVSNPDAPADADLREHLQKIASRLANHAKGFGDVLDESDRGPWGRLVCGDIDELRAALADLPAPADRADSRALARTRIAIDLNSRDVNGRVVAYLEDASGPIKAGDTVTAFEAGDGIAVPARVVQVGPHGDVYLDANWDAAVDDDEPADLRPKADEAQQAEPPETPIVAYRDPKTGTLYCARCGFHDTHCPPMTADDLPDGGICDDCGVDVLIPQAAGRG